MRIEKSPKFLNSPGLMLRQGAALFLVFLSMGIFSANASADSEYYWKDSYGRGVGTIPPGSCPAGKEGDAGLCYVSCRPGYRGVGPVCWENAKEYDRGAGTIPEIRMEHFKITHSCGNKEDDAGLCYNRCRSGYHGVATMCIPDGGLSYGRGVGTPLHLACTDGKQEDAGLCYTPCRSGFGGIGPVCWGDTPHGYVSCGAGYAQDSQTCGVITAGQVVSVFMLLGPACSTLFPPCGAAFNDLKATASAAAGKMSKQALADMKVVAKVAQKELEPLFSRLSSIFRGVEKGEKSAGTAVAEAKTATKAFFDPATLAKMKALLSSDGPKVLKLAKGIRQTDKDMSQTEDILYVFRDLADLVSTEITLEGIVDPAADTPPAQLTNAVCGVISSYMYPVYGE
jgi:hypothetical protein